MDLFDAIQLRRSVKEFQTEAVMSDTEFRKLMDAVLLTPTSYNIQHWRFIRVTDRETRLKIKDAAWGQRPVADASEVVLICADMAAWNDRPERYWANANKEAQDMLLTMMYNFYNGKPQLQRDEAIRSTGMAAQTLMLAAKAMGYDTNPMIGFDVETMAEIINLPEHHVIGLMVAIGKAAAPANPRGGQLALEEVVFENRFH
ncbi:nitroreductase [Oleiphilus messinensis]|uniref:Nitroreductase n=1 Tax=Oleiphilus messinensis TaxID=141451 RepID=A0A1Y0IF65_9GAMM|nr:nitroreductase family protein [Oleiphilus messinensis]ARU59177.1 nitroreductase [Oleiphilus messinensis]